MEPIIKKEDIERIKSDLEIIKNLLLRKDPEGELSDWAKKALKEARARPESEYISLEEVKRKILAK